MLVLFFIACDSGKVLEPCVDIDLESKIGDSVMTGVVSEGLGNYGYCGEREGQSEMGDDSGYLDDEWNGKEVILSWTAPKTAQYSIYTIGSEYDTTLSIKRTCNGEAISCDDDSGDVLDSLIRLPAKADETYLIVLDAYDSEESGNWVLNIVQGEPNIDWDYDTGWADSGWWWDSGNKSTHDNQNYACEISEWGLCYDQFSGDGWGRSSALVSCNELSKAFRVTAEFHNQSSCMREQYVGECHMSGSSHMMNPFKASYSKEVWNGKDAETACTKANGFFIEH